MDGARPSLLQAASLQGQAIMSRFADTDVTGGPSTTYKARVESWLEQQQTAGRTAAWMLLPII